MIQRTRSIDDLFADDARILDALRQARLAAARRHHAAGLPLLTWTNDRITPTSPEAVVSEIKEKKKPPAGGPGGGMDDMDY